MNLLLYFLYTTQCTCEIFCGNMLRDEHIIERKTTRSKTKAAQSIVTNVTVRSPVALTKMTQIYYTSH